ncbi:TPA: SPFH domain-containing protein [Streptococcus suis]|uniref:SPFH domain-containing protein n=1 Tax=Streptococcus suis TaxID=1307 RepID=UPI0015558923|nr:SPFH domain-containing protein [Streptococcus suis]NQN54183.1 SPFH domain-containing protein [Streptococcus suis]HEP1794849.1 SPFH domain-containing protein [Streptococcus suis]
MGILKDVKDVLGRGLNSAIDGTIHDQWKEIITAGPFDEHTVVTPGVYQAMNNWRGENYKGNIGVITSGSKISIPENTAAFIFDHAGIEEIITTPGEFIYQNGESSIFSGSKDKNADIWKQVGEKASDLIGQVGDRLAFGGQASADKRIAFVNLREIRNIKFGTRGGIVYNDAYYGTDLEIFARGNISLQVIQPETFIRNFLPPNVSYYSFSDKKVKEQILSEFLHSFVVAVTSLSDQFRISQLPTKSMAIAEAIEKDDYNAGTWLERFGLKIVKVAIENIEFSPDSKKLVHDFSANKMHLRAYDDANQRSADIAAQQKIADGVNQHGLGDAGGLLVGMNLAQQLGQSSSSASHQSQLNLDEQIEAVTKLKQLFDMGILSEDEFAKKKKEILGL